MAFVSKIIRIAFWKILHFIDWNSESHIMTSTFLSTVISYCFLTWLLVPDYLDVLILCVCLDHFFCGFIMFIPTPCTGSPFRPFSQLLTLLVLFSLTYIRANHSTTRLKAFKYLLKYYSLTVVVAGVSVRCHLNSWIRLLKIQCVMSGGGVVIDTLIFNIYFQSILDTVFYFRRCQKFMKKCSWGQRMLKDAELTFNLGFPLMD